LTKNEKARRFASWIEALALRKLKKQKPAWLKLRTNVDWERHFLFFSPLGQLDWRRSYTAGQLPARNLYVTVK
jgi:hypothetical protein